MTVETFFSLIESLGAILDRDWGTATLANEHGQFIVDLVTGRVQFRPPICERCKHPCGSAKPLCIRRFGRGWANTALNKFQLVILAEIFTLQQGEYSLQLQRQLTTRCLNERVKTPTNLGSIRRRNGYRRRQLADRVAEHVAAIQKGRYLAWSRARMYHLRMYQVRRTIGQIPPQRVRTAFDTFERLCKALSLPRAARRRAVQLYTRAFALQLMARLTRLIERSIEAMVAATLYLACREQDIPRTLGAFVQHCHISYEEIELGYRQLAVNLPFTGDIDPSFYISLFDKTRIDDREES